MHAPITLSEQSPNLPVFSPSCCIPPKSAKPRERLLLKVLTVVPVPDALRPLHELLQHRGILVALGVGSVVLFVLSVVGVPFFLARLPTDYYSRTEQKRLGLAGTKRPLRTLLRIAKNALGALLVVLGIFMLVLPGQGLLTLLVGIMLVDFPGKYRFERRILSSPRVLRVVNALRKRSGKPPLEITLAATSSTDRSG